MSGAVVAFIAVAMPRETRAQLFSPGKLARPHAFLEGLSNCTECHQAGDELKDELCLDCHEEIAARVRAAEGYHGRLAPAERACVNCHLDHQGLDYDLVGLDERRFDHRKTGWNLTGAHREIECRDCHDPRLVVDPQIRRLLAKSSKQRTYLGTAIQCSGCHFDEHRGQLGTRCDDCHDTTDWSAAAGFDHATSDFPLRGAHAEVQCSECHPSEDDPRPTAFPAPVEASFTRYAPLEFGSCASCHDDPHRGRFGADCAACHRETSWADLKSAALAQRGFHEETRYPLAGLHRSVACEACHVPLGARAAVYAGLPFGRCDDCHLDAHAGQVETTCEHCHIVEGFSPTTFGTEAHRGTAYPLLGAHDTVPCRACHPRGEPEPAPDELKRALARRRRDWLASGVTLTPITHEDCRDCHRSPHGEQFRQRLAVGGCASCHVVDAFDRLTFDHAVDTTYPLRGAHIEAPCSGCHETGSDGVVAYEDTTRACAGCHADIHGGQFERAPDAAAVDPQVAPEGGSCATCHVTDAFVPTTFDHAASDYPLVGKHREVPCGSCHPRIPIDGGGDVAWYRGVPTACEGCHADFHRGDLPGSAR